MGYTNFLRVIMNDYQQGPAMAEFAVEILGMKDIAIIFANNDYGRGVMEVTVPYIEAKGGNIVVQETFVPAVDKDFTPQLTNIRASGAEALLILGDYTEAGLLVRQMRNMGMDDIVKIGSAGVQSEQFVELAGTDAAEGTLISSYWNPESTFPLAQEYVRKFRARYNQTPDERMAYGYDIPYLLKIAIEKGATRENLADVLRAVEYQGITGFIAFEDNGDVRPRPGAILVVRDGGFTEWIGD
jgi:branched-chain amino acid transport system substrate-binding protein